MNSRSKPRQPSFMSSYLLSEPWSMLKTPSVAHGVDSCRMCTGRVSSERPFWPRTCCQVQVQRLSVSFILILVQKDQKIIQISGSLRRCGSRKITRSPLCRVLRISQVSGFLVHSSSHRGGAPVILKKRHTGRPSTLFSSQHQ